MTDISTTYISFAFDLFPLMQKIRVYAFHREHEETFVMKIWSFCGRGMQEIRFTESVCGWLAVLFVDMAVVLVLVVIVLTVVVVVAVAWEGVSAVGISDCNLFRVPVDVNLTVNTGGGSLADT